MLESLNTDIYGSGDALHKLFSPDKNSKLEDETTRQTHAKSNKAVTFKFDEVYLDFIQFFTNFCEENTRLVFNGDILFKEAYFPQRILLTEYVPINIISGKVSEVELEIPSAEEYMRLDPAGTVLYEDQGDFSKTLSHREAVIRDHIEYILSSSQYPNISSFYLESLAIDELTDEHPLDRLSFWSSSLPSFISRHCKSLKKLHIQSARRKETIVRVCHIPVLAFPELHDLSVILLDDRVIPDIPDDDTTNKFSPWTSDWFPDCVDHYWINLLKSQVHGKLRKLRWISAASLCWNTVFQPLLNANRDTLDTLYIHDTSNSHESRKLVWGNSEERENSENQKCNTRTVLSCCAFTELSSLRALYLRKPDCYLSDLKMLPKCIEELSIDDLYLESHEIIDLLQLSTLKILKLTDNALANTTRSSSGFGVTDDVLKGLLHCRSLHELCIWGSCLQGGSSSSSQKESSEELYDSASRTCNSLYVNVLHNIRYKMQKFSQILAAKQVINHECKMTKL